MGLNDIVQKGTDRIVMEEVSDEDYQAFVEDLNRVIQEYNISEGEFFRRLKGWTPTIYKPLYSGEVTIPKDIRNSYCLSPGDSLRVQINRVDGWDNGTPDVGIGASFDTEMRKDNTFYIPSPYQKALGINDSGQEVGFRARLTEYNTYVVTENKSGVAVIEKKVLDIGLDNTDQTIVDSYETDSIVVAVGFDGETFDEEDCDYVEEFPVDESERAYSLAESFRNLLSERRS